MEPKEGQDRRASQADRRGSRSGGPWMAKPRRWSCLLGRLKAFGWKRDFGDRRVVRRWGKTGMRLMRGCVAERWLSGGLSAYWRARRSMGSYIQPASCTGRPWCGAVGVLLAQKRVDTQTHSHCEECTPLSTGWIVMGYGYLKKFHISPSISDRAAYKSPTLGCLPTSQRDKTKQNVSKCNLGK